MLVTFDFKEMGRVFILWMVCAYTKMIKGVVIKDKKAVMIMQSLHNGWCLTYGFPAVGLYADNGGEFRNYRIEEFVNEMGMKIEVSPAHSPQLNAINERNHYIADLVVKKIREEDSNLTL